ncbi:MAG: tRNA (adenosine(37)-N6)-dimethylallyltransferase MiaA, partial [Dolichospermum sp.]
EQYALQKITELAQNHAYTIVVGGTGLYLKAFCEGLDEVPKVDLQVRNELISLYENNGLTWLQQQVKENDHLYWQEGEIHNPQRLLRALEVVKTTGKSIIDFQRKQPVERPFKIVKLAIDLPREVLYSNINTRVLNMIDAGLVEEVNLLAPYKHLNALQTVGYKEVFDYLEGAISLSVCIVQIQQHTRNYAKRQVTWFKNQGGYQLLSAEDIMETF